MESTIVWDEPVEEESRRWSWVSTVLCGVRLGVVCCCWANFCPWGDASDSNVI